MGGIVEHEFRRTVVRMQSQRRYHKMIACVDVDYRETEAVFSSSSEVFTNVRVQFDTEAAATDWVATYMAPGSALAK